MLTQEYLKSVLHYEPETGIFTWLKTRRRDLIGKKAGCILEADRYGTDYWQINLSMKCYKAHRLAWLYMTGSFPKGEVDHRDNNGLNNACSNLRDSTHQNNVKNRILNADNTSGVKGVTWHKKNKRWTAQLNVDGVRMYLGSFTDRGAAADAMRAKRAELHGEFTNHG